MNNLSSQHALERQWLQTKREKERGDMDKDREYLRHITHRKQALQSLHGGTPTNSYLRTQTPSEPTGGITITKDPTSTSGSSHKKVGHEIKPNAMFHIHLGCLRFD